MGVFFPELRLLVFRWQKKNFKKFAICANTFAAPSKLGGAGLARFKFGRNPVVARLRASLRLQGL